jgi:hypothetical protein
MIALGRAMTSDAWATILRQLAQLRARVYSSKLERILQEVLDSVM